MKIAPEIARDMRQGHIFHVAGERIGIRRVKSVWFNPASGHYVADCGSCYMWAGEPDAPWQVVPRTTAAERRST
jgi:hypothetical protein